MTKLSSVVSAPWISRRIVTVLWALPVAVAASMATAQTAPPKKADPADTLETVIVTGSHIRRTESETPSPVQVLSAEQVHESGYTSLKDVLNQLTANGQGTLSQSFSGAFASGASGVALRGLNVGATLVLIDGHRMAPYPIGDDGVRSFVDISNIPFDTIERVEVLKDGASAIYGSDAIAGVVNIILKKTYEGAQVTADGGTSSHADGNTYHVSGLWGMGNLGSDGHNFYLSAEFRQQNQIRFMDRGGLFTQRDFTSTGGLNTNLGAANELTGTTPRAAYPGFVVDPATGNIAGFFPGCNATSFAANQCTYQDTWDQIQPATKNYNFVGKFTQTLAEGWEGSVQGTYFESKAEQVGPPSRANTGGYQGTGVGPGIPPFLPDPVGPTTIPSTNPSFPAGTGLTSGLLHDTLLNLGPTVTNTDAKSVRVIADINGHISGWDVEGSVGFTEVKLYLDGQGYTDPANLQAALNSTTAPFLIDQPNSAAVNDFVAPPLHIGDTSKLSFGHLGVTRSIIDLPGGPLGVAVGADYLQRYQHATAPLPVQNGESANFSNNFTVGLQQVASGYAELLAPIVKQFELDAAVRYDHYNLSGGKASPKIGFKFTPLPELALRGTASKGFRAPGPAENGKAGQSFFAGTANDPILCPNPGNPNTPGNFPIQCVVNIPGLQGSNPNLKPETSKAFTFGVVAEPFKELSATADLYSIEIDNQIVPGGGGVIVRGNNLSPLQYVEPDGTQQLVTPPVAPITYQSISYVNANTTKTDGLELGLDYHHVFDGIGEFKSNANWTFIRRYDVTIAGTTYSLAGTHGPTFYSGDTGNPKSRVSWSNSFSRANWSLTATMNYISSFSVIDPSATAFNQAPQDTCLNSLSNQGGAAGVDYSNVLGNGIIPPQTSCTVKHFTTLDLYGRVDVTEHLNIHASILNVTNTHAPPDWATYGGGGGVAPGTGSVPWNPSLHLQGAIGPFFNLGVTYKF